METAMIDAIRRGARVGLGESWACPAGDTGYGRTVGLGRWRWLVSWVRRRRWRLVARCESATIVLGAGLRALRKPGQRAFGPSSRPTGHKRRAWSRGAAWTLAPGRHVQRYVVERVLGEGGFGVTYLARSLISARLVAIKEYFPREIAARRSDGAVAPGSMADEADFEMGLARFTREAMLLARFRHPNIVKVRRFFRANGTAYLVMRYEDGRSLREILARHAVLTEAQLRQILFPLLGGLSELHRDGLLHRDIKPENIYVRCDGKPVLLDFGAARYAFGTKGASTGRQELSRIYTPGYAPHEQYSGSGRQNPATDIYGLAATLYRAVTGTAPPEAADRVHDDRIIPAARLARGRYGDAFLAAIDRGLRVHNADRPQSVEAWRATFAR